MKNFFRKQSVVTPLGEQTQKLAGKWSPQVLKKGWGYALAFIGKQFGVQPFEIADTNSMLPLFDYDHLLYAEPLNENSSKLRMYDVCIYEDLSGALIVHRIVKVDEVDQRYYFQGDNNLFGDGWIGIDRIKYRVVAISYAR